MSLVLVSHSRKLAFAVRDLVRQMVGHEVTIAVAAGVGERHQGLGTDAVYIANTLRKNCGPDGVLVLMDLGSAVLSAEAALELIDPALRERIRLCSGPLVEGALAAAVQAAANLGLDEVFQEAQRALAGKQQQLSPGTIPATEAAANLQRDCKELTIEIKNEHGLHARPAASLIRALGKYQADVQIINQTSGRGPVSARSMTSLALLQVKKGDQLLLQAHGVDRAAALAEVSQLAAKNFGDAPETISFPMSLPRTDRLNRGIPASDGIAIGPLVVLRDTPIEIPEDLADHPKAEFEKLVLALETVRSTIGTGQAGPEKATDIMEAQALILDDPTLTEKVRSLIEKNSWNAARAWAAANLELCGLYEKIDDPYLRARAADVRDIGRRVLRELLGQGSPIVQLKHPSILLMDELPASDAAALNPSMALGVIARQGSPTSHSSILMRSRGIPMVICAGSPDAKFVEGINAAIDGGTGEVWLDPDPAVLRVLVAKKQEQRARQQDAAMSRELPSITLDQIRIEILANVGNVQDAEVAAQNGAEGIGLLRTEFLFTRYSKAPTEAEQTQALREIFSAIAGSVIVRTLDVGADKPLAFQPTAHEMNPFLGIRGIRSSLRCPEFFLAHLRAILAAAAGRDAWLMLPMVSVVDEIHQTRALLRKAHEQLESEGRDHLWPVKLGVMIEVPSAALMAEQLAEEAEFFSIGTNDLTQYVMAAERGNSALANLQDALQPAALRLMKKVANSAAITARHVSVCGDAASDPAAAAVFAGLGIRSLSVRPKQVAEIKALFRRLKYADLTALAHDALQCVDAGHVRALCSECFAKNSLNPAV